MSDLDERQRLAKATRRKIHAALVLANVAGSSILGLGALTFSRQYPGGVDRGAFFVALAAAYAVFPVGIIAGFAHIRRGFAAVERWLGSRDLPTIDVLEELAAQPRRQASYPVPYWGLSFVTLIVCQFAVGYRPGWVAYAKELAAFVVAAATAWMLSFLLVERILRPVFAALPARAGVDSPVTVRTFPKLLGVWLVSSGAPLALLAILVAGLDARQQANIPQAVFVVLGSTTILGLTVTVVAARAVAEPLRELRRALRSIGAGDLDVRVPTTDGGEIGVLQCDFNLMADQLRDRAALRRVFGSSIVPTHATTERDAASGGPATAVCLKVVSPGALQDVRRSEKLLLILNGFYDLIAEAVALEGGVIDAFTIAGVVCRFGSDDDDDHAGSALRAARALRPELVWLGRAHGIETAIAVASGDTVVGRIGPRGRRISTAVGDPVDVAGRLVDLALAHPSRVLACRSAVGAANGEAANWMMSRQVRLRGRHDTTDAFEPRIL